MPAPSTPAPPASPPAAPVPPPAPPAAPAPAAAAPAPAAAPPAPAAPLVPAGSTPAPAGAPTAYALSVPADATDLFDKADLQAFETRARAKNWTNEQAQTALVDFLDEREALHEVFRAQTEADETYGGVHLVDTQRLASLALDKVRPAGTTRGDAFRSLLVKTGYGNNLEVVAFLADLGKTMAEDRPGAPGTGGSGPRDAAAVLYGGTSTP